MLKKLTILSVIATLGLGTFIIAAHADAKKEKESKDIVLSAPAEKTKPAPTPRQIASYWIGVNVVPVPDIFLPHFGTKEDTGLLVVDSVIPDAPAAKAGLKRGDVILQLGGKDIHSRNDLIEQVAAEKDKEQTISLIRDGEKTELKVTPAQRTEEQMIMMSQGRSLNDFHRVPGMTAMPPQPGMRMGKDLFFGRDPQKMMRQMEEYFRQMQGGTDEESVILVPDDDNGQANGTQKSRSLSVKSFTENGKTKIRVNQKTQENGQTKEQLWEADSVEGLPEEIRSEVQGMMGK